MAVFGANNDTGEFPLSTLGQHLKLFSQGLEVSLWEEELGFSQVNME